MLWSDFYERYIDWSESTIISRISSLEDIGTGEEIIEVLYELSSEKAKDKFIRKAIRLNATFTQDDFVELEGELSENVYKELGAHTGFDAEHPSFNEDNLMWDEFYELYDEWSETDLMRRIGKLKSFGPADEVSHVALMLPNDTCKLALCKKAIRNGVKFTEEQRWDLDIDAEGNDCTEAHDREIEMAVDSLYGVDEECEEYEEYEEYEEPQQRSPKLGFFGGILAILGAIGMSKRRTGVDSCNDKQPHYGYRYGRWYYGRGHRHNCQEGGSGMYPQRTSRD